ncbi:MAG TPA: hypothetical protein VD968_03880, partial [Pyrinomonadaceae bacterium]|nr:hypothetical protein [Pyrinomonadaceae bacterium]
KYTQPSDGALDDTHDRPPLVLRATVDPSGVNRPVIVVVNHTRSFIDIELVAGDGLDVRAKRKAQAESIAGLFQELQTNNPGVPVIAVGDYNAFQFNNGYDDPVSVMKGNPTPDDQIVVDQSPDVVDPNFANLIDDLPAAEQYSFIFEGTPQALDHVLVNTAARARNTRVAVGRVNADFPEVPAAAFASDASRPERNSDHDPVVAYFTLAERHPPGSFIITEFRFRGPGLAPGGDTAAAGRPLKRRGGKARPERADDPPSNDEFIEFYNNTDSDMEVSTSDGSDGWALVASDGVVRFVIPNGTVIPARNYYLAVNENGYSLGNVGPGAEGDFFYTADIPDGAGIAIFRTSNPANFTESERLDAAGYASAPALYREGAGLDTGPGDAVGGAETTSDLEHSFVRTMDRRTTGRPKDINDNADDFVLVMTEPNTSTSPTAVLGAPGPQGMEAPKEMNAQFPISLIDPQRTTAEPPNRTRNLNDSRGLNGTMALRKTITNETGQDIGFLRFRIVEFTTFNSAQLSPQQAELISINSEDGDLDFCSDFEVQITGGSTVEVHGTSREEPPAQPNGGGLNSTLIAICAPLPGETTIAEGASFNVEFLFAVNRPGNFRFFINVEALPVQTQQPSKPSVRGLRKTASPALKGGRLRP